MSIIDTSTVDVTPARARARGRWGVLGGLVLLVRRRLWRDRWLVVSSALIVALATLLASAGPELVLRTIDDGAADAVTAVGPKGDLVVQFPVGNPNGDNVSSVKGIEVTAFGGSGDTVVGNLPRRTQSVVSGYTSYVLSSQIPIGWSASAVEVASAADQGRDVTRQPHGGDFLTFGYAPAAAVTLVSGALPGDPVTLSPTGSGPGQTPEQPPIPIAISQAMADAFGLGIGDRVQVNTPVGEFAVADVTGIVAPADPAAPAWAAFPEFTAPVVAEGGSNARFRRGTVIVSEATMGALTTRLRTPFPGTVRIAVDATLVTLDLSRAIASEVRALPSKADDLLPDAGVSVSAETGLDTALAQYPSRARAALAQMSIIIAGVVAVAAVVIALMARLLLSRREHDISLERARGASVTAITLRLLLESILVTAAGVAIGFVAARMLAPDVTVGNGLSLVVAVVAIGAGPIVGALLARSTWTGRREPANRQDRAKVAKARQARRLTLEALAVIVGALAVVTLRGRGVLQTQTSGIDPFLAAAPVLVALAVVVVVVRVYPLPMAIMQALSKRTRGVRGVITLAKARERIPVLPLLAMTLAIAVAVSGGVLIATVQQGQAQASWERVGSAVRVDAEVTDGTAQGLTDEGLTVSRGLAKPTTTFALGSTYEEVYLLAMDPNYPDILDASGTVDAQQLRDLDAKAASWLPGDPVPVLASQSLIDLDVHDRSEVYVGRTYVPVTILGLATVTPDGWAEGPYVIMPEVPLMATEFASPVSLNLAFVHGAGAADAVAAAPEIADSTVTTRAQWLSAVRDSALIGGVERAVTLAVIAVGILAAVGLLVTVLQGVRERGRALSMLRTQGMGAGYGWWLALAELGPLAVAAVVGGAGAGLLSMILLGATLGLEVLAGGIAPPELVADTTSLACVGGGVVVLLFFAVAVEVMAHRRNKLSDVLRYGESR